MQEGELFKDLKHSNAEPEERKSSDNSFNGIRKDKSMNKSEGEMNANSPFINTWKCILHII